jgi:XTP/dITP diphosphohydrolase
VTTYVLATANPDKAAEVAAILEAARVEIRPRPGGVPDVDETGSTLEENALLKARAIARATGMPAIADDTGLFVDALDGAPGVYSARYAGEGASYADNVTKLLGALETIAPDARTATFRTVAAVVYPDGREHTVVGELAGTITNAARGDGGFGYDPVFAPTDAGGRTLAEMSAAEKNDVSHRGRAFRALAPTLATP